MYNTSLKVLNTNMYLKCWDVYFVEMHTFDLSIELSFNK
jgi:hypothetical protein